MRRAPGTTAPNATFMDQLTTIEEVMRLPSPAPAPQALACDGDHLWLGSWETQRIYGIDRTHFTVFEEMNAPGRPVGMVSTGDELRVVISEGDDNRVIRRYIEGHGFKGHENVPCPDDTGSFLAYDGTCLWLSQRYNHRVLQLDAHGAVLSMIEADTQILGIAWVDERLYLSLWYGKDGGCKIGRASQDRSYIQIVGNLPFAAVSLTHDGSRFWCNDPKATSIVAFTL